MKKITSYYCELTSLLLLFALWVNPGMLSAQNKSVLKGTLLNLDREVIKGASIAINPSNKQVITDEHGHFVYTGLGKGKYQLKTLNLGHEQLLEVELSGVDTLSVIFELALTEAQMEEIIVLVNRRAIPSSTLRLSENVLVTPQNIQIMDKQLFQDQAILSLAEGITKNVSGVRTVYHQEEGKVGIYARGYGASNLRNGMDVSGSFGPLREDMSFIERIEFVKGPAGFMMGNTQPGGFYNIVTKKPTGQNDVHAMFTLGSFGLYRASVDVDGKLSDNGKVLGRLNLMGTKKGSFQMNVSNEQYVINPSLKYLISDKTELITEYIYSQNSFTGGFSKYVYGLEGFKDVPREASLSDPIVDPTVTREHNLFSSLNHYLTDNWMLTTQLGYIYAAMEGESLYARYNSIDVKTGDLTRSISMNDAINSSVVGQVFLKGKFAMGNIKNQVLAGLDMGDKFYVADWSEIDQQVGPVFNIYQPVYGQLTKSDLPLIDRSKSLRERGSMYLSNYTYYSIHLQDEAHLLADKLRIGAGIRYTHTSQTSGASKGARVDNSAYTPRFSITGLLTPTFTLYGLYDQSFQEQTGILENGDAASPSRGINKEIGLKKSWFDGQLLAGITAYHLTRTNITTPGDPNKPGIVEQSGEAISKGLELDIVGKLGENWNVLLNYAYTDAQITKDNNTVSRVGWMLNGTAKHITNAWLTYHIKNGALNGLDLSAGYEYQNKRSAWPVTLEKHLPDDLFSLDAGATYRRKNFLVNLMVNNVTDRFNYTGHFPTAWGYKHYGWRALSPRSFRLTVGYTL
ncbi:TonB-dependent receptor domain-containing protein [Sphingobacterium sp. HJSM2_6]|uniref:TonB-dependent receptor domain-containing protein n=1 Tax=Sphingobacterium sp. HJSM2_6 TaxID=3366264 RepID=UPI003BC12429